MFFEDGDLMTALLQQSQIPNLSQLQYELYLNQETKQLYVKTFYNY